MAAINVCLLAVLIVSVAACDGTSEQEPASSRNSESLQFSRSESYENDSIRRVDNYLGETLRQTTWFYQGWPLMRTRWQSDGYGHVYEFTPSGHLIGISEAIYGVKHGYECHLDSFGHIVNVRHFVDGEETDGEPGTKWVEPTGPEVEVEEHYAESDTGMYLQLRIFTRQDQVIESHRFLPDGSLALRTRKAADGYGLAFFSHLNGAISLVSEARFGLLDGTAIAISEDGQQIRRMYVNGGIVCEDQ